MSEEVRGPAAARRVGPQVELIAHTVFRDPGWYPEWHSDAKGDAAHLIEFAGRLCFDEATDVLTDRGWRRFSALERTERVATLDPETWAIEFQRPTDYYSYACDEPLVEVRSPMVNLTVTAEHRLYAASGTGRSFRLRPAGALAGHSLRFLRAGHWRGAQAEADGRFRAAGAGPIHLAAGGGLPSRRASPVLGVRARSVPLLPFLGLLGRYLAGGVCYAAPGHPGRVVVPAGPGVGELAASCGFAATERQRHVVVEDAVLFDYLGGLGETHSKRIPRPLLALGPGPLQVLRESLFAGRRRFVTQAPRLADDVQELLLKTGSSGNREQTPDGRHAVTRVDEWTPLVRRGPRLQVRATPGRVWCLSVPNQIVYVRREGVPVWAGNCYQSWANPLGRTNGQYIENILGQEHFSVIEHASATVVVRGVSRSLTHELVRHRHFSFSQLSQRFVDEEQAGVVLPVDLEGSELAGQAVEAAARAQGVYGELVREIGRALRERVPDGITRRKMARQAARSVLPNMTETQIVVTGNLRAWAGFLRKRGSEHAEAEIRRLAIMIWRLLRGVAPEVFDHFRCERTADGREVLVTDIAFD